jgi:hypothetical protein
MVHASLWMSLVYELVKAYGLWVLFIRITLECMGIPVPGETVLVSAAGYQLRLGQCDVAADQEDQGTASERLHHGNQDRPHTYARC